MEWRERAVASGEVVLHVREVGPTEGPSVVLVHGYPDCGAVWDDVAAELAPDHHVVVYDVRGMGRSSAPASVEGYRLRHLADDVFAVADAVSPGRPVHLVGHDWGSIQAWEAVTDPDRGHRLASYTTISGPCLDHVGASLRAGLRDREAGRARRALRQGLRSGYVAVFQVPGVADLFWRTIGAPAWRRFQAVVEDVRDDGRHPTLALDGRRGLELYRQNMRQTVLRPRSRPTDVPVRLLTLTRDAYVGEVLNEDLEQWVPNLTRSRLDAKHWAPRTHPAQVAAAIAAQVADVEPTGAVRSA